LTRLLRTLPWSELPNRPVIGFSDGTALLAALDAHRGGSLVHGPVVNSLPDTTEEALEHLDHVLHGRNTRPLSGDAWVDGHATGPIIGGNLSVLAAMCGTPWQPDARGKILLLEEIGEPAYRIDRLLQQLADAGVLRDVAGIALGGFTSCSPPKGATWTLRELLLEQLGQRNVPVVGDLPFGHISNNYAIPIGAQGTLRDGKLSWSPPVEA
jgi:muramoyltetrapeptide carboxypeptidase